MTADLKNTTVELERRRRYMEIVLKNVAAGVISFDEKGNVTTINTSAEQMLEIKGETVLEKNFSEVLPKEYVGQLERLLNELKSSRKDSIERQVIVNLEGKSLSLLINLTALRDEEGRPDDRHVAQGARVHDRAVRQEPSRDRNEFLPTMHGFDEFFGNLYHLNAEEEPEDPQYPKMPEFKQRFGPRGALRCKATDKDDPTVDPRFGKVGRQTIEARVTGASLAFDNPAVYDVEHETVSRVLSFTHTYSGQAIAGETIDASGICEQHGDEYWLIIGTTA
jgi:PAS domain S-box-containing protein